ncbi:MAG: D-glycero-beta-D-manno-heptose 1-phosphate adenylyltransferase [Pyrinomonadaceae bacterium]|nr:D-glycero-beta-D-manno-heptose 1-phosphate adenylyltransferase [Pyrinomonadaceae bacterium]
MEVVVFTNGCFDIIHPGHVELLERARALGTKLIVGINSDASVRRIKGSPRPYFSQEDRAATLKGLRSVDEVVIFEESTPENLIRKLKPDVLVKGGDWQLSEIVGADLVQSYGGRVFSIPLKEGYSSTAVVEKIRQELTGYNIEKSAANDGFSDLIKKSLISHTETIEKILGGEIENIERCAEFIQQVFESGNKVLLCGNGGSAADAQHIAAEFVGRYETERKALPAIALTTDTSALTALANDFDFERIFSRQVEALARKGDLLIAISTSGNSPNISAAVMAARRVGCRTLGLTGAKGKKLASLCDESILVPAVRTARIQESHILIAHIWCEIIDAKFSEG